MDNTTRFDGKGEIYAKARPKYAAGLFEYMRFKLNIPEGSAFADVGSGTGIFAEQLLACGYKVFAVEPNADMRRIAEEKLCANKAFSSVNGSDGNMNLPDGSVDCVTAAQAFHWFDPEKFRNECRRVLRPGGKVMIIYNSRDVKAECTKALAELHYKYSPEFHGFSNGINDEKCIAFFDKGCDIYRAANDQTYDRQGYADRVRSSSYSLSDSDEAYPQYLDEINEIFDTYSNNGRITVPVNTVAYIGTV